MRSLTFTIDPGTASERSYRFAASDILEVHNQREVFPISAPDIPIALFLAKLPPLPPGAHRVAFSIEMSSRRCDGLGTASENCRNAGTRRLGSCPFVPIHGCAAAVAGVAALVVPAVISVRFEGVMDSGANSGGDGGPQPISDRVER